VTHTEIEHISENPRFGWLGGVKEREFDSDVDSSVLSDDEDNEGLDEGGYDNGVGDQKDDEGPSIPTIKEEDLWEHSDDEESRGGSSDDSTPPPSPSPPIKKEPSEDSDDPGSPVAGDKHPRDEDSDEEEEQEPVKKKPKRTPTLSSPTKREPSEDELNALYKAYADYKRKRGKEEDSEEDSEEEEEPDKKMRAPTRGRGDRGRGRSTGRGRGTGRLPSPQQDLYVPPGPLVRERKWPANNKVELSGPYWNRGGPSR
jgi:hypothetical protein